MKNFYKAILIFAFSGMVASCSKKNDAKPATTNNLSTVATSWTTSAWGGVDGNPLNFTIDANTAVGTITYIGQEPFNFSVGDQLYTKITANSDGTFSATGKYTYGQNNANSSTRGCTLSLQNSGNQLTAYYPAITGFPALTYIYQKGSTVVLP